MAMLLCGPILVSAQTIESLEWIDAGGKPTARIVFQSNVRFLRQAPSAMADLVQVSIDLGVAEEASASQPLAQESRRLPGREPLPDISLNYAPSTTRVKLMNLRFV
ncbi:MAG: hypothetical protein ACR2I0_05395, partial [Rhodoferax sp.]